MSKFIIRIYFLLSVGLMFSQNVVPDSIPTKESSHFSKYKMKAFNLRLGFDIGNYIYAKTQDLNRVNFNLDSNIFGDYFLSIQAGNEEYLFDNQLINMSTSGNYWELGIDYNLYDNWPGMDNQLMLGLHFGHANFTNILHEYIINQTGNSFPAQTVVVNQEYGALSANWIELQSVIQVELMKNIYLGYNISFKYLLSKKKYENFELTYIPGFRKVNSTSPFGFGMQYFISYRFKIKKAPK